MNRKQKAEALKNQLIMEAQAKAHKRMTQKQVDVLLNEKPRIYLVASEGELV